MGLLAEGKVFIGEAWDQCTTFHLSSQQYYFYIVLSTVGQGRYLKNHQEKKVREFVLKMELRWRVCGGDKNLRITRVMNQRAWDREHISWKDKEGWGKGCRSSSSCIGIKYTCVKKTKYVTFLFLKRKSQILIDKKSSLNGHVSGHVSMKPKSNYCFNQ